MKMRILIIAVFIGFIACTEYKKPSQITNSEIAKEDLLALLDTVWITEQGPIRLRDSIGRVFGFEAKEFQKYQEVYERNHAINEKKIRGILDEEGWPSLNVIGDQGNLTICNVLQHSEMAVRLKYLPMMKEAVKNKNLSARLLARAEDRIATDRGELQIYGGQLKYYPETKSFDVWPILDPENVDKRRAEIGLVPMAEFLKSRRRPMEWNLEQQIKRTEAFLQEKEKTQ